MANSYLPQTEAGLLNWSANFNAQITAVADPDTIGLSAAEVTAYTAVQADYAAKYTAAVDPATRGSATVLAKNIAKQTLISESRKLAMAVTSHPGVTDEQRHDMGLTVRDNTPTPVPPPSTSPTLDITSVDGWTVNIRLHNGESTSRAKPVGVKGAYAWTYVGETAPTNINEWHFEGSTSKTNTKVLFSDELAPGTKVWLTAAWVNGKFETGPACTPVSTVINYGGLSQAA